jgi:hypothetical protein
VQTLCILGDLTDAKDYHPAELPNRIVKTLLDLHFDVTRRTELPFEVLILMGNHDYLKGGRAYFEFLNALPGVRFITKPHEDMVEGRGGALFLPHSRNPAKDWAGMDFSHFPMLFLHQTIKGARASNGEEMEGEALPDLSQAGKVYSGDIHVPQQIGPIEYVGSPYHVRYGDNFTPRCVLLDRRGQPHDLHFKSPRRVSAKVRSLRELRRLQVEEGDSISLTILMSEAERPEWPTLRRGAADWFKERGVDLHSIKLEVERSEKRLVSEAEGRTAASPEAALLHYVEREELGGEMFETGLEVMR